MKKSMKLMVAGMVGLSVSFGAFALATPQASPYAYIYAVYAPPLVKGVVLKSVDVKSSNTNVSLPAIPSTISVNDKNQGLVTAYATMASQKNLDVSLTYVVTAGIGPSTCVVEVTTPNIQDKTQPLTASITNGCSAATLFNPVYSTNPVDGDQVVTINWKLAQ